MEFGEHSIARALLTHWATNTGGHPHAALKNSVIRFGSVQQELVRKPYSIRLMHGADFIWAKYPS